MELSVETVSRVVSNSKFLRYKNSCVLAGSAPEFVVSFCAVCLVLMPLTGTLSSVKSCLDDPRENSRALVQSSRSDIDMKYF